MGTSIEKVTKVTRNKEKPPNIKMDRGKTYTGFLKEHHVQTTTT